MQTDILLAILISFFTSVLLTPIVIPFLQKFKMAQQVREEGPRSHFRKSGTPTMGGLIILGAVVVTSLVFVREYTEIIPVMYTTLGFGLIGFLDDYIKIVMKRNLGLRPAQKMILQIFITLVFLCYLYRYEEMGTDILIPFTGESIELGIWYYPFLFFVMLGTVNGANFTDGLDGLESGVTVLISVFLTVAAIDFQKDLFIITAAVTGSLLGFLLFNVYPAKVFMGDTGSLALGGFVASAAIILKIPLFLAMVAFVYLLEVLSVVLQVTFFKITRGKRIFKMAPLHHHFEMCGWEETRIVVLFTIITALMCLLALKSF
ncbi:phospho-N-acetylmuramoyl-pentapeptide-transferase [Lachnospiraceae bacterium 48-33]